MAMLITFKSVFIAAYIRYALVPCSLLLHSVLFVCDCGLRHKKRCEV